MENEVKNEGQESLDNTVITTAPVVEDVIEETPAVEAMPSLEPIPAEPAPVAEPVTVEPTPTTEPEKAPGVEEI